MAGETRKLASFLTRLRFQELPQSAVTKAKNCLVDFLGVAIAGSSSKEGIMVVRLLDSLSEKGPCTIIGAGLRTTPMNAALANGIMAHALELDDGHRYAMGHPGATSIPASLSIGELRDAKGTDLLLAIVAGYEAFVKVGSCVNPSHTGRGFHTTGTCGTFGAAAAAGKLLGLNEEQMTNALGLAGTQAAGLWEFERRGTMSKPLHAGRAAASGVLAALLAEQGFTGPDTIIEGDRGFCRATSDTYDLTKFDSLSVTDLGICRVYFKRHAACRHFHSAIDGILQCTMNKPLKETDIKRIVVDTYSIAARMDQRHPDSPLAAKMSLPISVSIAALRGKAGLDDFTETIIKSPEVLKLASKVSVSVDSELDKDVPKTRGARVTILFVDGRRIMETVRLPIGEPENPLSDRMLLDKFLDLSSSVLGVERARKISQMILEMENHYTRRLTVLLSSQHEREVVA